MTYDKPLPDLDDPLVAPFFAAATRSAIVVQRCNNCGYLRWPPRGMCPQCLAPGGDWTEVAPRGQLWSYAVYHRAFDAHFAKDVPYTVGLIELDDGPRMLGLVLASPDELTIGRRVEAVFDQVTPEVTMVRWRPSDDRSKSSNSQSDGTMTEK